MSFHVAMMLLAGATGSESVVTGDFDRDGIADHATIVDAPGGGRQLVVKPGREGAIDLVITLIDQPDGFYFERIAPGSYVTACGKGSGPQGEPCPRPRIEVDGDTLAFGTREASQVVALWTGVMFEKVTLSD